MKNLVIITGVSRGLGESLLKKFLLSDKCRVLAISRSFKTEQKKSKNCDFLQIDLREPTEVLKIKEFVDFVNFEHIVFINNAGIINPIGKIGTLKSKELIDNLSVNTLSPILITNLLLKHSRNKLTILNISSGAAKSAINGWSAYCSAKASSKMFFDVLNLQAKSDRNVEVFTIDPGVMDTQMQSQIREAKKDEFPDVQNFIALKEEKSLRNADDVAEGIIERYLSKIV